MSDEGTQRMSDLPTWCERVDNPYLHGIYAPTVHETTTVELAVEGEIPRDLFGAYVRNGPNAVFEPTNPYHWFATASRATAAGRCELVGSPTKLAAGGRSGRA